MEVANEDLAWALSARLLDNYEAEGEELIDLIQLLANSMQNNREGMERLWNQGVIEGDYFDV